MTVLERVADVIIQSIEFSVVDKYILIKTTFGTKTANDVAYVYSH